MSIVIYATSHVHMALSHDGDEARWQDRGMNPVTTYLVLLVAAALEAGGDALVRSGLHSSAITRIGFFTGGALVLFAYGVAVNSPSWDFGKLLGVYVTLFFVVAQIVNLAFFHVRPEAPVLLGGAFVVTGGLIMTFWRA